MRKACHGPVPQSSTASQRSRPAPPQLPLPRPYLHPHSSTPTRRRHRQTPEQSLTSSSLGVTPSIIHWFVAGSIMPVTQKRTATVGPVARVAQTRERGAWLRFGGGGGGSGQKAMAMAALKTGTNRIRQRRRSARSKISTAFVNPTATADPPLYLQQSSKNNNNRGNQNSKKTAAAAVLQRQGRFFFADARARLCTKSVSRSSSRSGGLGRRQGGSRPRCVQVVHSTIGIARSTLCHHQS